MKYFVCTLVISAGLLVTGCTGLTTSLSKDSPHPYMQGEQQEDTLQSVKRMIPEEDRPISFLFVQEAAGGTLNREKDGSYTLALKDVIPYTIYFSDRPYTIAGHVPMRQFIDGFNWGPKVPPNGAIVITEGKKEQDTLIARFLSPRYNEQTKTLSYTVRPLEDYNGEGLAYYHARRDASLPEVFGPVSLYIDDCPDTKCGCGFTYWDNEGRHDGRKDLRWGTCWDWKSCSCKPCNGNPEQRTKKACREWACRLPIPWCTEISYHCQDSNLYYFMCDRCPNYRSSRTDQNQ